MVVSYKGYKISKEKPLAKEEEEEDEKEEKEKEEEKELLWRGDKVQLVIGDVEKLPKGFHEALKDMKEGQICNYKMKREMALNELQEIEGIPTYDVDDLLFTITLHSFENVEFFSLSLFSCVLRFARIWKVGYI